MFSSLKTLLQKRATDTFVCVHSFIHFLGALTRYFIAKYNAWVRCARFPLFTFAINVVGSIVLALVAISIDLKGYDVNSEAAGYILHSFQVGFLGLCFFFPSFFFGFEILKTLCFLITFVLFQKHTYVCAGSLTTVSAFIAELCTLPHVPFSYIYLLLTIVVTQSALIIVNGLYFWLA